VSGGEYPALVSVGLGDDVARGIHGHVGDLPEYASSELVRCLEAAFFVIPTARTGALEATFRAKACPIEVNAVKVAAKLFLLDELIVVDKLAELVLSPGFFRLNGEFGAP
jgi:hypothetical protein